MSNETDMPPAAAEQAIRRTRAELATTIDALERKLAARHLVEKGLDMFKDSFTGNEALNRGFDVVRANPVPVALIGLGAAWLIASNTGVTERIAHDERVEAARRRMADMASDVGQRAGELATDMAGKVGIGSRGSDDGGSDHRGSDHRALGHTGNAMVDDSDRQRGDGWMHHVTDMAQGALRSARDSGGAVLNRAGSYAGGGAGRVADQVSAAFTRNPLVIGAVGVMAGALLAALVPMSRLEHELLGETRDELWHRAEEAGEEAVTRVREAAAQAAVRAVDAAAGAAVETVRGVADKPGQG
jgi:hypothetical protein